MSETSDLKERPLQTPLWRQWAIFQLDRLIWIDVDAFTWPSPPSRYGRLLIRLRRRLDPQGTVPFYE
jgi:hypothetical protein